MNSEYEMPGDIVEEVELPQQQTEKNIKWDELPPLEKIKIASNQNQVAIKEPDKNCKRCFGRGYIGIRSLPKKDDEKVELPIPCRCIFNKEDLPKMFTGLIRLGSKERKKQERTERKQNKKEKLEETKKYILEKKKILKKKKKKLQKKINKK